MYGLTTSIRYPALLILASGTGRPRLGKTESSSAFRKTLEATIECGGDTDTAAAIAGALAGATVGESNIPSDWVKNIRDAPINVTLLRNISARLAELVETKRSRGHVRYFWPLSVPRNLFFLLAVLCHGFRRLLPPY